MIEAIYNFIALYRIIELGWAKGNAEAEMFQLWEPNGVWRSFMRQVLT